MGIVFSYNGRDDYKLFYVDIFLNGLWVLFQVKVTLSKSDSFKVRSVNDLTNAVSKQDIVLITVSMCMFAHFYR